MWINSFLYFWGSSLLLLLALPPTTTLAQTSSSSSSDPVVCDCGFRDENNHVWSEIWYADYSNYKSNLHKDAHYVVMDYTVNAKHKDTLNRVFDPNNVQIDEQGQVQLAVRKVNDNEYTSASFGTRRQDILYGTFRASIKTSPVPGTVAAFYFYRNDTCEIDIESLSRMQNPWKTFFSVQPQIYNPDGSASTLTNDKHELPFDPTSVSFFNSLSLSLDSSPKPLKPLFHQEYHEYRFDWIPDRIDYYIDGQHANSFNTTVPQSPGRVMLNHWTDGNPKYSGAAPDQDAFLSVANLTVFFNSSDAHEPLSCQKMQEPCNVAGKLIQKASFIYLRLTCL